jgi:excisionase family DNA binding protein
MAQNALEEHTSPGDFLSPEDLAHLLHVPLATVYRWNHFGTGPLAIPIGRHVRYRRRDVDSWIERQASRR